MLLSIAADERAALHFDDLASALDAGLPLHALGADAKAGERVVHDALQKRGVKLSATEDAVLLAAWRAGRVGIALRSRGAERRHRAEFARTIWAGIRYPLLLFALVLLASFATASIVGHYWFAIAVVVLFVTLAVLLVLARRGLRAGDDRWARVPILGRIANDLGELPYLETLHSLYAAGVPLNQAHAAAVAAVPMQSLQRRLQVADRILQDGRSLTEALTQAVALNSETRTLIATGEQAGQLEDALQRALKRRREVAARDVATTSRRIGTAAYALAVIFVIAIVVSFYRTLYGSVGWHR